MMYLKHFPSVSDFPPYFQTHFSDSLGNFTNFTFSQKIFRFSSAKISDDLFSHQLQIHPYFACFSTFPPISLKLLSPYFLKCPPCFRKMYVYFTYFTCISFPPTLTMIHLCITQYTYWTPLTGPQHPVWSATIGLYRCAVDCNLCSCRIEMWS